MFSSSQAKKCMSWTFIQHFPAFPYIFPSCVMYVIQLCLVTIQKECLTRILFFGSHLITQIREYDITFLEDFFLLHPLARQQYPNAYRRCWRYVDGESLERNNEMWQKVSWKSFLFFFHSIHSYTCAECTIWAKKMKEKFSRS